MRYDLRDYEFYAGPLEGKKVRDVTDDELSWAAGYNRRYIEVHENPQATTHFRGQKCTVGRLPAGVAERRAAWAREALQAIENEQLVRKQQRASPQRDQLVERARQLEEMSGQILDAAADVCRQLDALAHELRSLKTDR